MAGRGSAAGLLAFGNANKIVKDMARKVLPVVKRTPVLAGVNGTDPIVLMPQFLADLKAMGFAEVNISRRSDYLTASCARASRRPDSVLTSKST